MNILNKQIDSIYDRQKNLYSKYPHYSRKRQIMRQSLNSTPPVMGGAASGIRPEDYLTMA